VFFVIIPCMKEYVRVFPWERISKFAVINIILWFVNIGIAALLIVWGVHYMLASIIGILLHIVVAFFLHRSWVFKAPTVKTSFGLLKSILVEVCVVCVMLISLLVLVEVFAIGPLVSRPIASIPSGITAWVLHSLLVFGLHPFKK